MVQKTTITCDGCGKTTDGTTYSNKTYNRDSKLTIIADLCQPCFLKMVDTLGIQKVWKKWNANTRGYENAN